MKIISPFNDYYDHAIHPSQVDEHIRYVRKTSVVPFDYEGSMGDLHYSKKFSFYQNSIHNKIKQSETITIHEAILTIGRNAYQIIVPDNFVLDDLNFRSQVNGIHCKPYGAPTKDIFKKSYVDYLKYGNHTDIKFVDEKNYSKRYYWQRKEDIHPFAEGLTTFDATELCLHYQTPIILIAWVKESAEKYAKATLKVVLNPPLGAFNMVQVLDPFQAWQEISMWIGGVMPGACSPMVELSNESKIEKAGFDKKLSFRKRPEN